MKKWTLAGAVGLGALVCWSGVARADALLAPQADSPETGRSLLYSGALYTSDLGLTTGGPETAWGDSAAAVRWDVWANDPDANGAINSFTYEYTVRLGESPDLSHMIVQLTDDITSPNISNFGYFDYDSGTWETVGYDDIEVDGFSDSPSNPGWPEGYSMWGIKFDDVSELGDGGGVWSFRFESLQVPTWGDVYLKGGSDGYVYNQSFGVVDSGDNPILPTDWLDLYASSNWDPFVPYVGDYSIWAAHAVDGSPFFRVVTADSITLGPDYGPGIPEPGSGLLAGMVALAGLACRRPRRRS